MKKSRFTLVMFALMAAIAAQAQVLNQYGNSFNEDFSGCGVIPAKYSSDSKAYLVTTDQGDKNTQLSMYDDKLNKVKTIDIAEPENARGYAIEKERGEVTEVVMTNYDKYEVDSWKDWMLENGLVTLTLEEAKSYLASINFNIGSTYVNEDTTFMLSSSQNDYFFPDYYEQKYPEKLYFYLDGKLYKRINTWIMDNWDNPSEVILADISDNETSEWTLWKKENNLLSLSLDEAKSFLASGWGTNSFVVDSTSTSVSADTTYLFSFRPEYYFSNYEEDFGRMYPTLFFAYSSDGKLFTQSKWYDITRSYTGEWKETKYDNGYTDWHYPENIHIMNYNESPDYEEGITLTQTLFNNDDAYEYIMPVFTIEANTPQEKDRDNDGETDYIYTYYASRANAFKVVSDNGNTLQTVDMPTGLSFEAIYLLNINDEQYLLCHASKKEDFRDSYSIFYTIGNNGGSTQIQQVGEPMRTRVHPTVAGRNETITVELDGNGNGEKEIFVSNAAGQTVYKSKVAAGQKQVLINASGLSRGMNIISVRGGKGKTNSNKVIVK